MSNQVLLEEAAVASVLHKSLVHLELKWNCVMIIFINIPCILSVTISIIKIVITTITIIMTHLVKQQSPLVGQKETIGTEIILVTVIIIIIYIGVIFINPMFNLLAIL